MKDQRKIEFCQAIKEGTSQAMKKFKKSYLIGLGVPDPKGIFGTTLDLKKQFGNRRVFDMPVSENGMTGVIIGSAIAGMRPIITHQRVEFSLLAVEQIINQAAKWNYMTNGKSNLPIVIRLIIGKGWGQGPQHSQSLEAMFAHIPGLKVVAPFTPDDAKGLIISSIADKNPIIFFEHRWLHNTIGAVNKKYYTAPIGKGRCLKKGKDISLISFSYGSLETLQAAKLLSKFNINAEVIDLRTLRPLDKKIIIDSVKKNKRVLVVDNGWKHFSISSEVITVIAENCLNYLKASPVRMGIEDVPIPSSPSIAKYCYPTSLQIVEKVLKIFKKNFPNKLSRNKKFYANDIPGDYFSGPF
tara:strand:+ start:179 stop:1243 length:1065 start_codon:yes stop_codon:yes gene_type:complete